MDISKDQLLQQGEYYGKPVVLKTKNYVDTSETHSSEEDQIIQVPALRSASTSTSDSTNTAKAKG